MLAQMPAALLSEWMAFLKLESNPGKDEPPRKSGKEPEPAEVWQKVKMWAERFQGKGAVPKSGSLNG